MSNKIDGTLTPKKISAPGNNTELSADDKKRFNKCSYKGGWFPKKYRAWTNLTNFINNKTAQCGQGKLYIGSPTGDRPQPAPIHISNFSHSLKQNDKVHKITVSFKCRVLNVKDGGGAWTENLIESEKAVIQGYRIWFGGTYENNKLSEVKTSSKGLKYTGKTKNGYNWISISETFTDISIEDIFSNHFALNIAFGPNCSKASTECDIFIKSLSIDIQYENSEIYIKGSSNPSSLYTSTEPSCKTTLIQTVEAGYISNNTKVPPSKAPAKLGGNIVLSSAPSGVQVKKISSNDTQATFRITDNSNTSGHKYILYKLNNHTTKTCKVYYDAQQRPLPVFSVETEYKANEDFDSSKEYIIFKNGCTPYINVYVDNINTTPLRLNIAHQNSTTNLLDQTAIQSFHNKIKALSCGTHTLYFQRGNEDSNSILKNNVEITIKPMEYQFEVYSANNPTLTYDQVKKQDNRYENIIIKRVDNEPRQTIPSLRIVDETNVTHTPHDVTNIKKGDEITHQIDKYYAGTFYIKVFETNVNCVSQNNIFAQITVKNTIHKQNFDYLFTRGENGTAFDYDYLVAWEGDNIKKPIVIDDMTLYNSDKDIRLCCAPTQTGLSQVGLLALNVTNKTENRLFEHIKIELNALVKNDDDEKEVTTHEWTSLNGIFNQFYALFNDYNKDIIKNVSIENLTPDNDLIGEENVYIHIQSLDAGDTITILLPFKATIEKEVYLQFLLFEEPQKRYNPGDCLTAPDTSDQPTDVCLTVVDSMLTQLDISGCTDLLKLNDTYVCPTECYTTTETSDLYSGGVTYTITNIDTGEFSNLHAQTVIENSNELQPYAYKLKSDTEVYHLYDEQGNLKPQSLDAPVRWEQDNLPVTQKLAHQLLFCNIQFPNHEETTLIQRTNSNGFTEFYVEIPHTINKSYTIDELLAEVVYIEYKGSSKYNPKIYTQKTSYPLVDSDFNKYDVMINHHTNYRRYKPGQIAHIPIYLTANVPIIKNKIIFNPNLKNIGSSDSLTVFYKICNLDNNQGVFKTKFYTNDKLLIPNEVSKDIYCGIDTDIITKTKLEKQVIESKKINVLHINVSNQLKLNKDVLVKIDIGKHEHYIGNYQFLDINIDEGDYSIEDDNGNIVILWQIGEMQSYQTNKGIIKIKAHDIGLSNIQINTYDYLHNPDSDNPLDNSHHCNQCPENSSYTLKDSLWENIDGIWYKKINGTYQRRVLVNGVLQWVNKDDEVDIND